MSSLKIRWKNSAKVATKTGELAFEDGIFYYTIRNESEIEIEDSKVDVEEGLKLSNYTKNPVFVDIRGLKSISDKARSYCASDYLGNYVKALAILVESFPTRLIGNFFINFHKPPYPAKIFTSEKDAMLWLEKFK